MRDFAEHKFHRRIMQSAFKTSSMQHYIHAVNELAGRGVALWRADRDFHFYPQIKSLLLEIGARVFVGIDLESEIERLNRAFLDMMAGTLAIIRKDWPGLRYRRGMDGRRFLEHFFTALVPRKRSEEGALDMMAHFSRERSEDGELYSDQVVSDHMIFLLLAAHDTTTSALTMGSYYLARHPEWQERLRNEVDALGRAPAWEDVGSSLPLLEQSFHEILRLHPPVPELMRRTIRETELGGYYIPADTLVGISPVFCHRMPEYWRDAQAFDPGRFGVERQEHKQHPFLWMPFGGGAHKCIGMHFADLLFKCVMAAMLRQYRFRLPSDYPDVPQMTHFPFAKLTDDLPLVLEPRAGA